MLSKKKQKRKKNWKICKGATECFVKIILFSLNVILFQLHVVWRNFLFASFKLTDFNELVICYVPFYSSKFQSNFNCAVTVY